MNTITKKEIAELAGVSLRTVVRREKEWGIFAARSKASRRPILYFRARVERLLAAFGVI
jgi:DNA-binding XRE family transcriptional regulator